MREHIMGLTEMIRFFAGLVISTKSLKKQRDVCLSICKEKQCLSLSEKRLTRRHDLVSTKKCGLHFCKFLGFFETPRLSFLVSFDPLCA